jgi:Xaa-Pro aminopeptidase
MFTRVLKGHIALTTLVFPINTVGSSIDAVARQFLWAVGKDYAHGGNCKMMSTYLTYVVLFGVVDGRNWAWCRCLSVCA